MTVMVGWMDEGACKMVEGAWICKILLQTDRSMGTKKKEEENEGID